MMLSPRQVFDDGSAASLRVRIGLVRSTHARCEVHVLSSQCFRHLQFLMTDVVSCCAGEKLAGTCMIVLFFG